MVSSTVGLGSKSEHELSRMSRQMPTSLLNCFNIALIIAQLELFNAFEKA